MKNILITFLLFTFINADMLNLTLKEYSLIVSKANNINILIDKNIDSEINFYISKEIKEATHINVFETILNNNNLFLKKDKDFYYISNTDYLKYRSIKLNFIDFEDIKNTLSIFENIKFEYIPTKKILLFNSNYKNYIEIKNFINKIDYLPKQLKLKVTILETNIDKLKELGSNNQLNIKSNPNSNFFYNLLAYPFTVSNTLENVQTSNFYTFIKFLNENKNTTLISSPVLTLLDNQITNFEVVTNIPYINGNTIIDDDISKQTNSYDYKDIGLRLSIKPMILDNNITYLNLELNFSNIISQENNLPITTKKLINQKFYLEKNKLFILTGINQTQSNDINFSIPLLSEIPLLGWLFKYKSNEINKSNLTILFELLDNEEIQINDMTLQNNDIKSIQDNQFERFTKALNGN
jgi:general secretion pathway protein D